MNITSVLIYYNSEQGYIIVSNATLKGSGMLVTIPPMIIEESNILEKRLGERVLAGLENSRNAMPVDEEEIKDFNFWHISGIKSFSAFSKKFSCVEIEEQEGILTIQKLIRNPKGYYVWDKEKIAKKIKSNCLDEQIGQVVYNLFHEDESNDDKEDDVEDFDSLNNHKVSFRRPTEGFRDIGDGHTDAYQIYTSMIDENSYIAFMIDNGYSEFSKKAIKQRWKKIYGKLDNFYFEDHNGATLQYIVGAKTKHSTVKSYFYKDGDDLLEVLTEVSNNLSDSNRLYVLKQIEEIVESITIE